jgi:sec-independent protein translocase protein TatC
MSNNVPSPIDPEDMFNDTRMSIGDHIEDLRSHLLRALKGLVIGMIFGFWPLGPYVLDIINAPVERELSAFDERKLKRDHAKRVAKMQAEGTIPQPKVNMVWLDKRQLLEGLGLQPKDLPPPKDKKASELEPMIKWFTDRLTDLDASHLLDDESIKHGDFFQVRVVDVDPMKSDFDAAMRNLKLHPRRVTTLGITEMFFVYMKISFFTGLVLSSPWVFYHIWMFIAAGLYPHEKKLVNVYLPFSIGLFIVGVLLCEFFAMGQAVKAMLWFNEWLDTDADIRLNEWLGFAIMMPVVFGLAFQTPLVMTFLHKVGLVTVAMMRQYRRIAWFVLCLLAALMAPAPDAYSLLLLWVPMVGLYELGILLCVWQGEQNRLFDFGPDEDEKAGELVEV